MTETPQPYNVPNPEEIDSLLLGDFGVDESPPSEVMEVHIDAGFKVLEVQKLLNELYLDFHHINRVVQSAFDEAEDNNPQAVCTMLGLIESQCDRSISKMERTTPHPLVSHVRD